MNDKAGTTADVLRIVYALHVHDPIGCDRDIVSIADRALSAGLYTETFRGLCCDQGAASKTAMREELDDLDPEGLHLDPHHVERLYVAHVLRRTLNESSDVVLQTSYELLNRYGSVDWPSYLGLDAYLLVSLDYDCNTGWMSVEQFAEARRKAVQDLVTEARSWLETHATPNPLDGL